ncbi:hypothetical protein HZA38_02695 [Candidatus Peregrinibacteria bacterium]|nr:hypothetical protein [Candidatus Peregrinibacteria bacterium]
MKFSWRIIGHEKILEKLEADFENGTVGQSYLLCGPREIQKFKVIQRFAELLQCEQKNMCRTCDACVRIEKNIHRSTIVVDKLWVKDKSADLEELAKYSNFDQSHRKRKGKKSDQIGVDDVLEFVKPLWQKTDDDYKVCIIRDIERMTEEAMNTFLKTLEEPPEKTIFLMTATHKEHLLPTIISRVRVIEMGLIPNSVLKKTLDEEHEDISDEKKEKILTLAQGRSDRLMKFLSDPDFFDTQKELFHEFSLILKNRNLPRLFALAEKLSKPDQDEEIFEFFDGFLHFLRTLLREKTFGRSLSLGDQYSFEKLVELVNAIDAAKQKIEKNVNRRLALEELFLSV